MNFTRTFDIIHYQAKHYPLPTTLAGKPNGRWQVYGTQRVITLVDRLSKGLLGVGVTSGDKIALISTVNRPEWNIIDMAVSQIGAVLVPLYATLTSEKTRFILQHAEVKLCIVNTEDLFEKVQNISTGLPHLEGIYTIDVVAGAKHWKRIMQAGQKISKETLLQIRKNISPKQLATIIYTSGTTGDPKGVMLSHQNIVSNVKATLEVMPLASYKRAVSLLPLSHIFERTVNYIYMARGISIYHIDDFESIQAYFQEVRPHYLVTAPILLEKIYERTRKSVEQKGDYQQKIVDWAISIGEAYDINRQQSWWYRIKLFAAQKLLFNRWKKVLGNNIKAIVVGASALRPLLGQLFNATGIIVREGYGLTETSPIVAFGRFEKGQSKIGTTGNVIPGVEVKIKKGDGEILVRGSGVMMGYYKNEFLTQQVIDEEGWFHTGDIGEWDEGYLKITGRKKELFKISSGEYIAPQAVEERLKESMFISQIAVVGEHKDYVAALIVPDFEYLGHYCQQQKLPFSSNQEMIEYPEVITKIHQVVENYNGELSQSEHVKKIALLANPWTVKTGEITPSLKLKRKVIQERYRDLIEELYSGKPNL